MASDSEIEELERIKEKLLQQERLDEAALESFLAKLKAWAETGVLEDDVRPFNFIYELLYDKCSESPKLWAFLYYLCATSSESLKGILVASIFGLIVSEKGDTPLKTKMFQMLKDPRAWWVFTWTYEDCPERLHTDLCIVSD